jgi:hypothetical protein
MKHTRAENKNISIAGVIFRQFALFKVVPADSAVYLQGGPQLFCGAFRRVFAEVVVSFVRNQNQYYVRAHAEGTCHSVMTLRVAYVFLRLKGCGRRAWAATNGLYSTVGMDS